MLSKVAISVIQADIVFGNPEKNRQRMFSFIKEAARRGSKVAVLPELWTTGYSLENIHEIAEPLTGKTISGLLNLCSKHEIYVVGSMAERKQDGVYNTCVITGPEGIIGTYSKVHLFRLMNEHKYLRQGTSCEVFQTTFGKIATVICYDVRFPELIRKVALNGAHILFVPAEWPYPRLNPWRYLLLARAIENQLFVVAANRVGADKNNTFFGHSMVIDPVGEVLVEAGDTETILTCELDLGLVDRTRNLIPCFKDRRPDVYLNR